MSLWNFFLGDWGEEYTKLATEIKRTETVRAAFYPVEPNEVVVKDAPISLNKHVSFEEIQTSIKVALDNLNEPLNMDKYDAQIEKHHEDIKKENNKIIDFQNQLSLFKEDNQILYNKIENLKKLGFENTPSSVTLLEKLKKEEKEINDKIKLIGFKKQLINNIISDINKEISKIQRIKELTINYSLKYPSFKFIDTESFTNILHKYRLVLGDTGLYNKEIPENVLVNISKFSKEIENSKQQIRIEELLGSYRVSYYSNENVYIAPEIDNSRYYNHHNYNHRNYKTIFSFSSSKLKIAAPLNHFNIVKYSTDVRNKNGNWEKADIPLVNVDKNTRCLITNIEAFKEIEKRNLEISRKIDDPIAVLKVEGGFIIIDAWDKEALIPELDRRNLN